MGQVESKHTCIHLGSKGGFTYTESLVIHWEREREMVKFPRWRIHSYRRMQNEETEETFRIVSSYAEDGSCCACLDNEDRLISCKSLSLRSLRRERRKRRRGGKGELIRMEGKKKFGKKSSIPHSLPMEERYEQVNL